MDDKQAFSIAQRVRSFGYAAAGLRLLIRREHNAWIHACATALVFLVAISLSVSAQDWAILLLAMAMVWISEGLNTAIEYLANAVTGEFDENIKHAKDVAAGAVLLAAGFAVAIAGLVFFPYILNI